MADRCGDDVRHELISLSERTRWDAALEGVRHAFGHCWEHCHAFALSSGLPTYLYHFQLGDARVVCPLSERIYNNECDVVTPYGFAGMAATGPILGFARLWREFAATQGWVCAYLQSNPLLYDPLISEEPGIGHNTIYVLDLMLNEQTLMANMSANRRRQLRARGGYDTEILTTNMEAADFIIRHAPDFFGVRSASHLYFFTDETWRSLLSSSGVLVVGARRAGKLEAVTVFGREGDIAEYMFNISTSVGKQAAVELLWKGIQQLRAGGYSVLNLGGGIRQNDDVAEFKRRFGGQVLPLRSLRQVFQWDKFNRSCEHAGVATNLNAGYFPPYHAVPQE